MHPLSEISTGFSMVRSADEALAQRRSAAMVAAAQTSLAAGLDLMLQGAQSARRLAAKGRYTPLSD